MVRKRHSARHVGSTPSAVLSLGGVPHLLAWGVPHLGIPPPPSGTGVSRPPPQEGSLRPATRVPPGNDMGPVEVLWDGDGVTPAPSK